MAELADPPGVRRDPALRDRLSAAYAALGPEYRPRTVLTDGAGRARYVNRLVGEASPYLLQHAHNPVDWHPWGEETLAKAADLDRPIFLSAGYATCHWCHVMEHESFDDEEVAAVLNAGFVPIKIDREQRPDLDHVYITATQLQQGHAGWPNSVFLMPDGRPFHTGTYFPKPHFLQVLAAVRRAWESADGRRQIESVATSLSAAVQQLGPAAAEGAEAPGPEADLALEDQLHGMFNAAEGGFSSGQQFPQEVFLLWLLDRWRRSGSERAREMALASLDAIVAGGLHDHAGGGFHRYTVDPNWRTPHFEKMLYNQGLLGQALVEAYEITGRADYRRAMERLIGYLARDMTAPDGAFYAAEDADSLDDGGHLEEGAFYAWTPRQVVDATGDEAAVAALGIDQIPTIEAGAVAHVRPGEVQDWDRLEPWLDALRRAREARARPIRDEKVIAGWNGLMIRALADASVAFDEPAHGAMAAQAAEALWSTLWDGERLARLRVGERVLEAGMLDDYAWYGLGLLALFDATGEAVWRERAETLARVAVDRFGHESGRMKMAEADGPTGPVFDSSDGATPSGESAMLELLARLTRRSADPRFGAAAKRLSAALAPAFRKMPLLRPTALAAERILSGGESGYRRTLADGALRVSMAPDGTVLTLAPAEGWHVNAHDPGSADLEGACVDGADAEWPAGEALEAGFADGPVRVHAGPVAVALRPRETVLTLHCQVCSHSVCLPPAAEQFRLR